MKISTINFKEKEGVLASLTFKQLPTLRKENPKLNRA